MEIRSLPTYAELCEAAADQICRILEEKPNAVFIFPTGNTPLGMFYVLEERYREGKVSFEQAYLFELDEYLHEAGENGPTLFDWLQKSFLNYMNFREERVFSFNPKAADAQKECDRIQAKLDSLGSVDLAILGLGPNGHLAMNEPGTLIESTARVVKLSPATLESNAAYWGEKIVIPKRGMTIGLSTFHDAKEVILMVNGSPKQEILKTVLDSECTPQLPATLLHDIPGAIVYADKAALGE